VSSAALLKRFETEVELTPVPGACHIHVIHPKPREAAAAEEAQMTNADWDKFEADINEAFERLP
jgi:hypothetical protein